MYYDLYLIVNKFLYSIPQVLIHIRHATEIQIIFRINFFLFVQSTKKSGT